MAKKKATEKKKKPVRENDDAIAEDKLIGYFTVAYVLDCGNMLNAEKRKRLDSLVFDGCPRWNEAVEEFYGINKTFVRNVYAHCTELKTPIEAVVFILRGLGCPEFETRLSEVLA